jgi:hypothetical protein
MYNARQPEKTGTLIIFRDHSCSTCSVPTSLRKVTASSSDLAWSWGWPKYFIHLTVEVPTSNPRINYRDKLLTTVILRLNLRFLRSQHSLTKFVIYSETSRSLLDCVLYGALPRRRFKQGAGKKQGERMQFTYQIDTTQKGGWSITSETFQYKISFFHLTLIYLPDLLSVPSV